MVGVACHPYPQIMLGGWHRVPIDATHFLIEVHHPCWHLPGSSARPQCRPEADNQVHSSSRHAWFTQIGHHLNQPEWITTDMQIELQIGVRACPQGKDPTLCDMHCPSSYERSGKLRDEAEGL